MVLKNANTTIISSSIGNIIKSKKETKNYKKMHLEISSSSIKMSNCKSQKDREQNNKNNMSTIIFKELISKFILPSDNINSESNCKIVEQSNIHRYFYLDTKSSN